MKTATFLGSALAIVYVNLVPYLCRLPHGVQFAAQYLPDEGQFVLGFLFLTAFASIPAFPLIVAIIYRRRLPATLAACVVAVTAVLTYWHHDYDVSADAQAAIGLVVIPFYALGLTTAVGAVSAALELLARRLRRQASEVRG